MITIKTDICKPLSQKLYNEIISSIQLHQLKCSCGHSGCLIGHGSYRRTIKQFGEKIILKIYRVKCNVCGKTHALMLLDIVPYSQIPLRDQADILANVLSGKSPVDVLNHNPLVDENNLRHILRNFRRHWKERLMSERLSLAALGMLAGKCLAIYKRQFMQIRKTANILFAIPT